MVRNDEFKNKIFDILKSGLIIEFDPLDVNKIKTKEMLNLLKELLENASFRDQLLDLMVDEFYRISLSRGLNSTMEVLENQVFPTYQCCMHARYIAKTMDNHDVKSKSEDKVILR